MNRVTTGRSTGFDLDANLHRGGPYQNKKNEKFQNFEKTSFFLYAAVGGCSETILVVFLVKKTLKFGFSEDFRF